MVSGCCKTLQLKTIAKSSYKKSYHCLPRPPSGPRPHVLHSTVEKEQDTTDKSFHRK